MKTTLACLFVSIVLAAGCSLQSAEEEEFVSLGSTDYSVTLSIFCLLDPEATVQNLTIERLSLPSGAPHLHFDPEVGIKITSGDTWRLFQRLTVLPLASDEWDHYAIDDSTLDIDYDRAYTIDVSTAWGAAARGSTVVPGPFEIISPEQDGLVDIQTLLTVRWSESPEAYGYVLYVFSRQTGSTKRYMAATRDTSFTLPYGLKDQFIRPYFESFEAGSYSLEVWAVDRNYFDFILADPDDPFAEADSGLDGASGIFGSRVVRRVSFTIG